MSTPSAKPLVLIVDDEPMIRELAIEMVKDAGFAAIGASTADEALALLRLDPRVRIVMTDVDMPGSMNGLGLARFIHYRWPLIRLIVTSGSGRPDGQQSSDRFLPKPYHCDALIDALQMIAA